MRRNLAPDQLGDLLTRPLNAVIALRRADGSVLQTPVWHLWTGSRISFYVPAGDRKIAMLARDPSISLIVAEPEHPFRAFQVEGVAMCSAVGFRDRARKIATRYVAAFDPGADIDAYVGEEDGIVVEVDARRVRAWDFADGTYT